MVDGQEFKDLIGLQDGPTGHSSFELFWDVGEREEVLSKVTQSGRELGVELRHKRADGSMFWGVTSMVAMAVSQRAPTICSSMMAG